MTSTAGSFAIVRLAAAQDTIDRVLSARGRRFAVTAVLLVTFVMVTVARLINAARLETFAIDLRIYRAAADAALAGHDPWAVAVHGLTFAGPPPTLLAYMPAAVLPEAVAIALYAVVSVVAAVAVLRALHLPLWWLLFPPISESLIVLNADILVIALLVAAPRFAALVDPAQGLRRRAAGPVAALAATDRRLRAVSPVRARGGRTSWARAMRSRPLWQPSPTAVGAHGGRG